MARSEGDRLSIRTLLVFLLLLCFGSGCSSAAHKNSAPNRSSGAPAPATTAQALPDVVFTMNATIEAGAEAMFCYFGQMPTDNMTAVPSAESHYTPGSHHFLVYRTNLTTIPDGGDSSHICGSPGSTVAVAGQDNGLSASESFMGVTGSYYEAQVPDAHRDLPKGVAHLFDPGEILLFTAHYLNASGSTLNSHIELRLHTVDLGDVEQEAGSFFLVNSQLSIPPMSEITVTRNCPIGQDVNLGLFWSHMHSRGYSFRAWSDDAVANQQVGGADVYDQPGPDGWSEPHIQTYPSDPPVTLHAGSNLSFSCTYHNTTTNTFIFGNSAATNEMCILHGMYWPRADQNTEGCLKGTSTSDMPVKIDM